MNEINQYSNHNDNNNNTFINGFNGGFALVYTVLLTMTMFSLAIITIVGNTIVIYALKTDRNLKTVIFIFI